ncbi:hypothetical protein V5R04_10790 [Jonesiaceae bacterium BS-20]|uniref:Lipoprotein n=1 Tax=Jonesiaceae bacterium BS-20 TaxID=3120821 RepID=A0AAU7DTT1_9MICO
MKKRNSRARYWAFLLLVLAVGGCASGPEAYSGPQYQDFDFAILEQEAQTVAGCVEERSGFVVDALTDGSLGYGSATIPESQWGVVDEVIDECSKELTPQPPEMFSVESLEHLYGLQIEARNCYIDLGYDLPEPTSNETFLDEYQSGEVFWNVIQDLVVGHRLSEGKAMEIFETCPDPFAFFWR